MLDKSGEVEVVKGVPDDYGVCEVSYVASTDKLRIGEVFLYPTQKYSIKNYSISRITMSGGSFFSK